MPTTPAIGFPPAPPLPHSEVEKSVSTGSRAVRLAALVDGIQVIDKARRPEKPHWFTNVSEVLRDRSGRQSMALS